MENKNQTAQTVLKQIIEVIEFIVYELRSGLVFLDEISSSEEGNKGNFFEFKNAVSAFSIPTTLFRLLIDLRELNSGRPSPLLSRDKDDHCTGPYNFVRAEAQAAAAALITVLMEQGMRERESAKLVTAVLNNVDFANPRKTKYAVTTVMDWRKRGHEKSSSFVDAVERWLDVYHQMIGKAAGWPPKDVQKALLGRFESFVRTFSYR